MEYNLKVGALDTFCRQLTGAPLSLLKNAEMQGNLTFDQLAQIYNKANSLGFSTDELSKASGYDINTLNNFASQQGLTVLPSTSGDTMVTGGSTGSTGTTTTTGSTSKIDQLDQYCRSLGIGSLSELKAKEQAGQLTFDQLTQLYNKANSLGITQNELMGATGYTADILNAFVQQQGLSPLSGTTSTTGGTTSTTGTTTTSAASESQVGQLNAYLQSIGIPDISKLREMEMNGELTFDQLSNIYNTARTLGITTQQLSDLSGYSVDMLNNYAAQHGLQAIGAPSTPGTVEPPKNYGPASMQGLIDAAMQRGSELIGGQYIAPNYGAGQQAMTDILTGAKASTYGAGQDMANQILSGQMLTPESNPYLQQNVQAALSDITNAFTTGVLPEMRNEYVKSGTFGGSRQALSEQLAERELLDQLSQTAGEMYGTAYGNERGLQQDLMGSTRQAELQDIGTQAGALSGYGQQYGQGVQDMMASVGALPGLLETGTLPAQYLGALGQQQQDYQQALIDAEMAKWDYGQQSDWANLQNLSAILQGGDFWNKSSTASSASDPYAQALGAAITAGGLYSAY